MTVSIPESETYIRRTVRHSSRIDLSQSALKKNINFIRKKIGDHPRLSCVVKANAYGHGIPQMVKMLEKCGVGHFSVASAYEGEQVLEHCSNGCEIMIMGILYDEDVEWAIENDISFFVFDMNRLALALEKSKKLNKKAHIHLEVETGTNRTGLMGNNLNKALKLFKQNPEYLHFRGICTHLSGAESMSNQFRVEQQKERFAKVLKVLKKQKCEPDYRHMACSAAVLAMPETHYDLVRVGVATYGFWPSRDTYFQHLQQVGKKKDTPMARVITWKTDVMDIKTVP